MVPVDRFRGVAWTNLFASWGAEMEAQWDRVGFLIGDVHRPSEGAFREILLRNLLRRVLPPRYRVSTGFVIGWGDRASTQMDVLVWDAESHTPLMEVGEFAVVKEDAVKALVEVKTTLDSRELESALSSLHPPHYDYWHDQHTAPKSRLRAPSWFVNPPIRGILAYRNAWKAAAPRRVLSHLAGFYRGRFDGDLKDWLRSSALFRCSNIVDVVGVGDAFVVEEGNLFATVGDDTVGSSVGYCVRKFDGDARHAWLARFCLVLANRIISAREGHWSSTDADLDRLPAAFAEPPAVALEPLPEADSYRWNALAAEPLGANVLRTPAPASKRSRRTR